MALDKEARTTLFGTPVLARQIRKCVQSKQNIPEKELRAIFQDVKSNLYHKTLTQLGKQGVLVRNNGTITFLEDAPVLYGSQADRAWKAALLLKTFSLEELCRTADIKWAYAQKLMSIWVKKGLAVKLQPSRSKAPAVWSMAAKNPPVRPITRRK